MSRRCGPLFPYPFAFTIEGALLTHGFGYDVDLGRPVDTAKKHGCGTLQFIASQRPAVSAEFGIEVSQSDLFRLGMIELEKKYPDDPPKKGKK
jgi:hypothetical protein